MEYKLAYSLARKFELLFSPFCSRILTVGSIRRGDQKAVEQGVHDIEFLLIPKTEIVTDLFGYPLPDSQQPPSELDKLIDDLFSQKLLATPRLSRKADGQKYKKFALPGYNYYDPKERKEKEFYLELWIVTERTWGIQAVIRTGPSAFSYAFVNSESFVGFHEASGKRIRGLLPNAYQYIAGETKIIIRSSRNIEHPEKEQVLGLPTEESALKLLGLNSANNYWIEPSERFRYVKEEK